MLLKKYKEVSCSGGSRGKIRDVDAYPQICRRISTVASLRNFKGGYSG